MAKNLEKYDRLVTALLIIVVSVLGIGYWFAEKKSEPIYLSKIDRLIFDKDNKAPGLVLTLPDKFMTTVQHQATDIEINATIEQPQEENKSEFEEFSFQAILAKIPNIAFLENKPATVKLPHIEVSENLTEEKEEYVLPAISAQGKKPWIEYGVTVSPQPNFKKVGIIIDGLGFDSMAVNKIASIFNSEVSLSFTPYTPKPEPQITTVRNAGHETYVDLILSSKDFLIEDTGPLSIGSNIAMKEAFQRYYKTISTIAPIGGVVVRDGAVTGSEKILTQLLEDVQQRGLLMIDATTSKKLSEIKIKGLARQKADIIITQDTNADDLPALFKKAENIAFNHGQVLLVVENKPFILVALYKWLNTFSPQVSYEEAKTVDISKPFAIVPVSNLVVEQ